MTGPDKNIPIKRLFAGFDAREKGAKALTYLGDVYQGSRQRSSSRFYGVGLGLITAVLLETAIIASIPVANKEDDGFNRIMAVLNLSFAVLTGMGTAVSVHELSNIGRHNRNCGPGAGPDDRGPRKTPPRHPLTLQSGKTDLEKLLGLNKLPAKQKTPELTR